MDFRLINEKTLPQVAALWDECFEKKRDPILRMVFFRVCIEAE